MSTIVDKRPDGTTVYRAAKSIPIPDVDILTLLFDSELCGATPDTQIHVSAADPSLFTTLARARVLTEVTSAALRRHFSIGSSGRGRDVVTVFSTGHYLLPSLCYGVIGAGGVLSAASPACTPKELAGLTTGSGSRILVCNGILKDTAVQAAEAAGWGKGGGGRVVVMSEGREWTLQVVQPDGTLGGNLVDENQRLPWERITDAKTLRESLVVLIYSSGTTGLPKGVKLSHRNLVAEAVIPGAMMRARRAASGSEWQYRTLAHLPVAHIAGIQGYLFNPVYLGGPTYWMARFDWEDFLAYNKKYGITFFFSVPPIYLLIAKSPLVTDQFASLQIAISGAAPLGGELQQAASKKLGKDGNVFISQTWGLSETTGSATAMPHDLPNDLTGSVSPLLPTMEARIVDDDLRDVAPGQPGEVLVRGPVVCNGYFNNDAANAESFVDGWFRTGDVGEFRDGLLYIVDRKKELIKYKGLQVAPAELEGLLLSHQYVLDAAVIGVPTPDGTNEVPRAYVVPAAVDGKRLVSEQDVVEFVKKNVAGHKQLRGGVVFVDAIPKSPAGKILRKDLRAMVKRERESKL